MCDRECVCHECVTSCTECKLQEMKLDECRSGGIKECSGLEGKPQLTPLESAKDLLAIQDLDGNWAFDNYMFGMYNGMEIILAIWEGRDPVFKEREEFEIKNKEMNKNEVQ